MKSLLPFIMLAMFLPCLAIGCVHTHADHQDADTQQAEENEDDQPLGSRIRETSPRRYMR